MRLTDKKIYEIVEQVAGKQAVPIVKYLKGKKDISDFEIADNTEMDMQTVRNLLYRLNGHNIVTYIRKKDKKKGWYISFFTLNRDGTKYLAKKLKKQKINKLKQRLKHEQSSDVFFMCGNLCVRMNFDDSVDFNFRCPECGELLKQQDNKKTINHLKKRIKELEAAS